jgi:DNA end-binding protein Ku
MAPRPIWEGHLRLSLVACPVALYPATSTAKDVHFHLLHKDTHNRIRMIPHDPELGEVSRKDLVRGFEIDKDRYVIVSNDELNAVKLESTRMIDIDRFVDRKEIDRVYWNTPYYLTPSGKAGTDAYVVIREAMRASGRVALGRLVLHSYERMIALEPRDKGFLLTTLLTQDEVRDDTELFRSIPNIKPDKQMIEIALRIIEQKQGAFDSNEFHDRYEDALHQLIEEKRKGHKPVAAPAPEEGTPVVNLMDALRKSLQGSDLARESRARRYVDARTSHRTRQTSHRRAAHPHKKRAQR